MRFSSLLRALSASLLAGSTSTDEIVERLSFTLGRRWHWLPRLAQRYVRWVSEGEGDFVRNIERFSTHVAAILMEEGFEVNHRKTRVMRQGARQHLAGVVVNQHMNIMRTDFDRLKATLTNCVRLGPESQNREGHPAFCAHLEGRVAFSEMINPSKGKRLRALFDQIRWA